MIKDFIYESSVITDDALLFKVFRSCLIQYGFNSLQFDLINDHSLIGKSAKNKVINEFPPQWDALYLAKNYELIDPVRQYACHTIGVFTWAEIGRKFRLSQSQNKFFSDAKKHGLHHGVGVSLRGSDHSFALITAAKNTPDLPLITRDLWELNLLATHFYTCYWKISESELVQGVLLTQRERFVVKRMIEGQSIKEVAEELNIRADTVQGYFRNVKNKLGTKNTASTVAHIVKKNLLFI